ncbi:MAG: ATP-binding cassette domain-containing protein, partial [Alphaproteobacteria bacterium]
MSNKIIISNLCKNFGSKEVLRGINIAIEKSKSLVILGGSGSGKSVMIKLISTLMAPSSGSIKIDDVEVTNLKNKDLLFSMAIFIPLKTSLEPKFLHKLEIIIL